MADENKDTAEMAEFEAKLPAQSSNKDVWLFLIIVDVVFLCVFGFFLYKNLSARLLSPAGPGKPAALAQAEFDGPASEEMVFAEAEEVVSVPEAAPAAEPVSSVFALPENRPDEVKKPEPEQEKAKPADKKDSILIKTNPKSKYRQVTFRYYGKGEKVAVVSGFTMAKPRALKKKDGYWETTLSIAPGTYKFLYVVDGKQVTDPYAEEKDGRSILTVK